MLLLDIVYIRILKVQEDLHIQSVHHKMRGGILYSVDIIGFYQHECRLSGIFYTPCSPTIHYDDLIMKLATIMFIVRELPRQSGSRTGLQPPLPLASFASLPRRKLAHSSTELALAPCPIETLPSCILSLPKLFPRCCTSTVSLARPLTHSPYHRLDHYFVCSQTLLSV